MRGLRSVGFDGLGIRVQHSNQASRYFQFVPDVSVRVDLIGGDSETATATAVAPLKSC